MDARSLFYHYATAVGRNATALAVASVPPPPLMANLGRWYDEAPHKPHVPSVIAGYQALSTDLQSQYAAMIGAGLRVELWNLPGQPYADSRELIDDVVGRNHLSVFPTALGFGKYPTLDTNRMLDTTRFFASGAPLCLNDVFRAVHDVYGHVAHEYGFGAVGEYNAFRAHAALFSPEALPALACETAAQNAWFNFGPHHPEAMPRAKRPYPDQKNNLVPAAFIDALLSYTESHQFPGGINVPYDPSADSRVH